MESPRHLRSQKPASPPGTSYMEPETFKVALFINFTDEPFTGYWNGKPKTFKPGEKKYMPAYLAEHFAKHLANKVLEKKGDANSLASMSPKKPEQVPLFMELFNQACIIEKDQDEQSELDMQIDLANRRVEQLQEKKAAKMAGKEEKGVTMIPGDENMDEDEDEANEFAGKDGKGMNNDQSQPSSMIPDPKK